MVNHLNRLLKWTGTIAAILMTALLTISILATNNTWYSKGINSIIDPLKGEDLLFLISTENHFFKQALPETYTMQSASGFFLSSITNFDWNKPESLLTQGLPTLSAFDTTIIYAGEGTDVTNMPRESLPPEEALEELAKDDTPKEPKEEENKEENEEGRDEEPSVLIYHTHSYESYLPELDMVGEENGDLAISSDREKNITRVGHHFADRLKEHGIIADVDDTNMNAYMSERGMKNYYAASRQIIEKQMEQQEYDMILDFHRDSLREKDTTMTINNETYARILFVVGESHPNAAQQQKQATELNALIEKNYPGLSRGVFEKDKSTGNGVYNQDLADTAFLIEFGGVDNTMEESLRSAEAVADILAEYYQSKE